MADHFHEVVWLIDRSENRPIYISPAYEAIAGRSRQGMYANLGDWFDAIHVDDREQVRRAFEEHATDGAFDMTYRLVRPDGSIRWIHDRGYPIRDESGHIHRIAGIAVDITERKNAEQRTRMLEDQLTHLARLDTMGEIASGLAHELNQPLAAICNYADTCLAMLDDESFDPDAVRHALTRVSQLTLRTGDIIDRLRKMVRREQPRHVAVSVRDLVDDIVSLIDTRLRINAIELHVDLPSVPLVVVVDAVQIQQVLGSGSV
jgi:PAS domain S-box-containing protein